jgi:DNA-binding response OmpR family regulator
MTRHRILVVEDDRTTRLMYRAALALAGFEVDAVDDGLAALQRIDESRPDLVVLDLHLPRVDGLSVLGELRATSHTCDIPVVVVTGTSYPPGVENATAVLEKPLDPDRLVAVITNCLRPAA